MQFLAGVDCRGKRLASRRLLEVGPFDLHGDGASAPAGLLAPGPDVVGHGQHPGLDAGRVGQVLVEGGLRSRRFPLAVRVDRAIVLAAGDGVVPDARLAEAALQVLQRPGLQIGAGLDAGACICAAVAGPTPWNFATGRASTNAAPSSGMMANWPFGLRWPDASLARNLL